MLSKAASSTIFLSLCLTQPGIETWSLLANTLLIRPMTWYLWYMAFFNVRNQAQAEAQMHCWFQKCLGSHSHSIKRGHLRHQGINPTKAGESWGDEFLRSMKCQFKAMWHECWASRHVCQATLTYVMKTSDQVTWTKPCNEKDVWSVTRFTSLDGFIPFSCCYILVTYNMDFWFITRDPMCFDKLSCCD